MLLCSASFISLGVLVPDTVAVFLRYDDYDYGEINQLLDRSFKIYIKTMVCSPEKTTKRMYESFWRQFQHSEKVKFKSEYSILDLCLQLCQSLLFLLGFNTFFSDLSFCRSMLICFLWKHECRQNCYTL